MKMMDRFEVTVWDVGSGDIVEKEWDCDQSRLDEIEAEYIEVGGFAVVVDKQWEDYAENYE